MLQAKTNIGIGSQVEDGITALHGLGQSRQIQIVSLDQLKAWVPPRRFQEFSLASGKVVPSDDSFALPQQRIDQVAADKSGRAGDKYGFQAILVSNFFRSRPLGH
jgi:hypothetical protein